VVGGFYPCLSFFFLIFLFFFFLLTRLLASELSLDEEDETERDLASEEGEENLIGEEVKDQHEVDVLGGKCLRSKHILHSGLPE
jgi:hypothetical protein